MEFRILSQQPGSSCC